MLDQAGSQLSVAPASACGRIALRGDESVRVAASAIFGLSLPSEIMRSTSNDVCAALKLGPDEWLLLVTGAASVSLLSACQRDIAAPHAAVDISDRQCALDVKGAECEDLLASGCPLDLSIGAFPIGMATRTLFGKCEIVLWRRGERHFRLEMWRSYLEYVMRRCDLDLEPNAAS